MRKAPPRRPRPNHTFGLLAALSGALAGVLAWSTHHLLLAGAPSVAAGGPWPGFTCLLLPADDDVAPHVASYAFLLAIGAGLVSGARMLVRQHRQTRDLLRTCLASRADGYGVAEVVAQRIGLAGRLDVVDVSSPIAFCYGLFRPRVLVSRGLVADLTPLELEALLLHEREHVRQRDPLKVAIGRMLASGVFFVPAIGALYRRYLVEKELAADQAAIAAQGSASSLMTAVAVFLERGTRPAAPTFSTGADEVLDARVGALLGDPVRLDAVPLTRSAAVTMLAVLPLVLAAPVGHVSFTVHEITAGCHLES